jgi:hypothetical protein
VKWHTGPEDVVLEVVEVVKLGVVVGVTAGVVTEGVDEGVFTGVVEVDEGVTSGVVKEEVDEELARHGPASTPMKENATRARTMTLEGAILPIVMYSKYNNDRTLSTQTAMHSRREKKKRH